MRAALYLRVSTTDQDTERQQRELCAVAAARGWDVVEIYADNGISGSKGRDKRRSTQVRFDRGKRQQIRDAYKAGGVGMRALGSALT